MALRLGTFNVENLMTRFDFSAYRNVFKQDRVLQFYPVKSAEEYERLEAARVISSTDDTRQLTALAIAEADADILCLQEVDNMEALRTFEFSYLHRMMGSGYRQKYLVEGNDGRGIDVAVMMREETADGEKIELVDIRSHAALAYRDLDLFSAEIAATNRPEDRIFRRDCLELQLKVGGRPLAIYVVHLKSMTGAREGQDGRQVTMPVRRAELSAVRHIITNSFGAGRLPGASFAILGDMNDYRERVDVAGDRRRGYGFQHRAELSSALDVLAADGFVENVMERRDPLDRWTLFHSRGQQERHLCQLDYIWLSPALARANADRKPDVVRGGQPFRTPFPPGQEVERFPRTGWDRPKASDHCPVVMTLDLP